MIKNNGITLAEVDKRLPRSFQTLGYDVLLDYDATYKPKVISTFEMSVNIILTLLFMKPGQYPSIPELGINIEQYIHEYSDDKSIPNKIKNELQNQCNQLQLTGINIECFFDKTSDGFDALVLQISGTDKLTYGSESNSVVIGISYDKLNRLYVRKVFN